MSEDGLFITTWGGGAVGIWGWRPRMLPPPASPPPRAQEAPPAKDLAPREAVPRLKRINDEISEMK